MKLIGLSILLLLGFSITKAQSHDTIKVKHTDSNALIDPEVYPKYNGDVYKVIADSLRYPANSEIIGTVYVSFTVEKDGSISGIRVVKGVQGAPDYDKEAIRVVSLLKNWTPGSINGKPASVHEIIPIRFSLR